MANSYQPRTARCYEYWAEVRRVVDGDTVDVSVSLGFDIYNHVRLRLLGINAPETHSVKHDSPEYAAGMAATEYLQQRLKVGSWIELKISSGRERGKYGRWLAEIFVDGENINQEMVTAGHAEPAFF